MQNQHNLQHLGMIMDGNRRWAKDKGLPSIEGHRAGYHKVKKFGDWCFDRGIKMVTVYAFSTENWKRAESEVSYLMDLILLALTDEVAYFHKKGIQVRVLGQRQPLSDKILKLIDEAHQLTKDNKNGVFSFCINYGGQLEIVDAVKEIIKKGHTPDQINEDLIKQNLYAPALPAPDMIVRTSGEHRLSNFLLWNSAYAELMFIKKHWPDILEEDIEQIIAEYTNRQRRYGQ